MRRAEERAGRGDVMDGEADGTGKLFPKGFLWGAATSSHQVEGNNVNNDWWDWEQLPGKVARGDKSGDACDHYNRYKRDFEIARDLGHNAHRLSLEWSRIEPDEGRFDRGAIEHYREVLGTLRSFGMATMVTLHHFTNPRWLAAKGGWALAEVVDLFERYSRHVAEQLGELVDFWITVNEPMVYATHGYLLGWWPPEKRSIVLAFRVAKNLARAHGRAYHAIHDVLGARGRTPAVGIAKNMMIFDPKNPGNKLDGVVARKLDRIFNTSFLDALTTGVMDFPLVTRESDRGIAGTQDFIGVNYYSRTLASFSFCKPRTLFMDMSVKEDAEKNSLGWEIYPEGLYRILMRVKGYGLPVYITENGICTDDDRQRERFILLHLREAARAIADGVDVCGYFHWSLMDNFEWKEGFTPRFGLVGVDYKTQKRTIRPSARLYSEVIREGKLP
ncbi:MAG: glycoside hydrolase family 1 protein [Firmicutes bacterium]|jgi:beta-glucosidase|nr:glycoside hydrolase family 1 protein [Bacillota bacterium]MDH7494518.1 glycoside hydrolase family 1 protein [Bacillota bacterium]